MRINVCSHEYNSQKTPKVVIIKFKISITSKFYHQELIGKKSWVPRYVFKIFLNCKKNKFYVWDVDLNFQAVWTIIHFFFDIYIGIKT